MENFGHFAAAFSNWKSSLDTEINFNDSRGYFWRLGDPAKEYWQPDYGQKVPNASPAQIAAFRAMFLEGGELLGIPVATSLGNFRGARLYKMSLYSRSSNISNLLVSYNGSILPVGSATTVSDPNTNESIDMQVLIKPETLVMTGGFDGADVIAGKTSGLIYGKGFRNQQRPSNRLGEESIMGSINYNSGNVQLIRSNSTNDRLLPEYEEYIAALGEDGSGFSNAVRPIGELLKIDLNLSFQTFGNPVSVVWEFPLDGQS